MLALAYDFGDEVEPDAAEALRWYQRADQHHAKGPPGSPTASLARPAPAVPRRPTSRSRALVDLAE